MDSSRKPRFCNIYRAIYLKNICLEILKRLELLIRHTHGQTQFLNTLGYGVEFVGCCLTETTQRCLAVNSINHYLLRRNFLQSLKPRTYISIACIVYAFSFTLTLHKHGLYDTFPFILTHRFYYLVDIIHSDRLVHHVDIFCVDSIQFQYIIVYKLDRFSRNKYETAKYKKILKDNKVIEVS